MANTTAGYSSIHAYGRSTCHSANSVTAAATGSVAMYQRLKEIRPKRIAVARDGTLFLAGGSRVQRAAPWRLDPAWRLDHAPRPFCGLDACARTR